MVLLEQIFKIKSLICIYNPRFKFVKKKNIHFLLENLSIIPIRHCKDLIVLLSELKTIYNQTYHLTFLHRSLIYMYNGLSLDMSTTFSVYYNGVQAGAFSISF